MYKLGMCPGEDMLVEMKQALSKIVKPRNSAVTDGGQGVPLRATHKESVRIP
jgi:hypothetical protein